MDDPRAGAAATVERPASEAKATQAAAPQEQPTDAAETAAAAESNAVQEQVDPRSYLDTAPAEELRSHKRIAGIVGQMVADALAKQKAAQQAEMSARAQADAERRMRELAQADPYTFAQQYLTEAQAKEAQTKLEQAQSDLAAQQADRFAKAIGSALRDVPEWKEMSQEEFEAISKEVGEDNDPESVFRKFLPKAIKAVAGKMSAKEFEARFEKEVKQAVEKEVQARLKEQQAARRPRQQRPDLARPAAAETDVLAQVEDMSPQDFTKWYEDNILNPSR